MEFSCKKRDHSVVVELPARTLQVLFAFASQVACMALLPTAGHGVVAFVDATDSSDSKRLQFLPPACAYVYACNGVLACPRPCHPTMSVHEKLRACSL